MTTVAVYIFGALATFLVVTIEKRRKGEPIGEWPRGFTLALTAASAIWPVTLTIGIAAAAWPALVKERKI